MSKYNPYAKRLDAAFKQTRSQYQSAYNGLLTAQEALRRADTEGARLRARADLTDAENAFQGLWPAFEQTAQSLTRELRTELEQDFSVKAAAVDLGGMALLSSGVLRAADFESLRQEYQNNPTMLRLLRKHALAAANDGDPAFRVKMAGEWETAQAAIADF